MKACGGSRGVSPTGFGTSCSLSIVIVSPIYLILKNSSFKFTTKIYAYLVVSIFTACFYSHLKFHDFNILGKENKLRKPYVSFVSSSGTYTILGPHVLLSIRSSSTLCPFSSVGWLTFFSHQCGRTYNLTWKSLFPLSIVKWKVKEAAKLKAVFCVRFEDFFTLTYWNCNDVFLVWNEFPMFSRLSLLTASETDEFMIM